MSMLFDSANAGEIVTLVPQSVFAIVYVLQKPVRKLANQAKDLGLTLRITIDP